MADEQGPYWSNEDQAAGNASRVEYQKNKSTQYNCKAKSLLYGEQQAEGKPLTPIHHGKRSVPHAGEHSLAPFATYDGQVVAAVPTVQGGQMAKTYQARHHKKEGAGKIGQQAYNSEVYRQAIVGNAVNMSQQKTRNWGSAGLLGQHPATPQQGGAAGLGEDGQEPVPHSEQFY